MLRMFCFITESLSYIYVIQEKRTTAVETISRCCPSFIMTYKNVMLNQIPISASIDGVSSEVSIPLIVSPRLA